MPMLGEVTALERLRENFFMRIYVEALLTVTWFTACGLDPADTRATT